VLVYRVINTKRNSIVADRAEYARTFFKRLRGLMFRSELPSHGGLIIEPTNSVHTFWMRFPIDVIFVNRQNYVVGLVHSLPPNRPFAGARSAYRTIELPSGTIVASGTELGDQLDIVSLN
jgi:uncharacterized protein